MEICIINDIGKKQNSRKFQFDEKDTVTVLFKKVVSGLKMNATDKEFFNQPIEQPLDLPSELLMSCLLRSYEDFINKRGSDFTQLYYQNREKYLKPKLMKAEFDFKTMRLDKQLASPASSSGGFGVLNLAMKGFSSLFGGGNASVAQAASATCSASIGQQTSRYQDINNQTIMCAKHANCFDDDSVFEDDDEGINYYTAGRYYEWDD